MKPEGNQYEPWEMCCSIEEYYTGDNNTRKSVTGYDVLINGVFVAWPSRNHKTVTLSITEDEYSLILEVCCKILFFLCNFIVYGSCHEIPHYRAH